MEDAGFAVVSGGVEEPTDRTRDRGEVGPEALADDEVVVAALEHERVEQTPLFADLVPDAERGPEGHAGSVRPVSQNREVLADIVISHKDRAVVRIGDVFIKIDVDRDRSERELVALRSVPLPKPEVLWHRSGPRPLLALSEVAGTPLAQLGVTSPHPREAWVAAGRAARQLHVHPVPDGLDTPSRYRIEKLGDLEDWLLGANLVDHGLIAEHASRARAASATNLVLVHGDLQAAHVFIDDAGEVSGVLDWSDAGVGDLHYDLAVLTVGHPEHLDAVLEGYGHTIDHERIGGFTSWRRLGSVRWMVEHGFDASGDIAALRHGM